MWWSEWLEIGCKYYIVLPCIDWANKNLNVKLHLHLIVSLYLRAKHSIQETRDQEGTCATCKLNDGNWFGTSKELFGY